MHGLVSPCLIAAIKHARPQKGNESKLRIPISYHPLLQAMHMDNILLHSILSMIDFPPGLSFTFSFFASSTEELKLTDTVQ